MDSTDQFRINEALDGARQQLRLGQFADAEVLLRGVLDVVPDSPDAQQLLGLALSEQGRYEEAIVQLRAALDVAGDAPALWDNLGTALLGAGRSDQAIDALARALEVRPDHAATLANFSAACRQAGQCDRALVAAARAIELMPGYVTAWNHLGLAMRAAGRYDDAILAFERALQLRDDKPGLWINFARTLLGAGRVRDALTAGGMAVSKSRGDPSALEAYASILIYAGRPGEASKVLEDVLKARPDRPSTRVNHGLARMELGEYDEALSDFRTVIEQGDATGEARGNAALALLLKGDFDEGWTLHEYRWSRPEASPRRPFATSLPVWDGQPLQGRRLLVWGEQGIGDEVMFAGLLDAFGEQGEVMVECDSRLVPLIARSMPNIEVVGRDDPPAASIDGFSPDVQIAMGSLAMHLRPDLNPPREAYLRADEALAESFRDAYGRDALRVGLSWYSGNAQEGPKRSLPLAAWQPVLAVPGARFVNLQYGDHSEEVQRVSQRFGVEIIEDASVDPLTDLDRFAAQVAAMDVVISIDNSTVHMAGSLGVETWALLPFVPDWRWRGEGEQSFWYASVQLMRQAQIGGFAPLIKAVALKLGRKISATSFSEAG